MHFSLQNQQRAASLTLIIYLQQLQGQRKGRSSKQELRITPRPWDAAFPHVQYQEHMSVPPGG